MNEASAEDEADEGDGRAVERVLEERYKAKAKGGESCITLLADARGRLSHPRQARPGGALGLSRGAGPRLRVR